MHTIILLCSSQLHYAEQDIQSNSHYQASAGRLDADARTCPFTLHQVTGHVAEIRIRGRVSSVRSAAEP